MMMMVVVEAIANQYAGAVGSRQSRVQWIGSVGQGATGFTHSRSGKRAKSESALTIWSPCSMQSAAAGLLASAMVGVFEGVERLGEVRHVDAQTEPVGALA
jgi:hypothetical protein